MPRTWKKSTGEYLASLRWRAYKDRNGLRDQSGPAVSLVTGETVTRKEQPSEWERMTRKEKARAWAFPRKRKTRPKTASGPVTRET